ncbi:hypothetical protein CAPTEDRAFT_188533 [Capitella teleta]|uniref:Fibronectin type-III domain-containing protein n=1 Tax=Capitella teleta TaxID=283909 RepID=R7TZP3_CAPTE|nr:hypothetical protein CAPTEDRAFT_188533 [Capitella teleta]|eukprot:ELT99418.1 hypothetical protein CAPTEDRAFT_188533 [Capitella teleta]
MNCALALQGSFVCLLLIGLRSSTADKRTSASDAPPVNLWCRSYNWLEMTCSWSAPPKPYHIAPFDLSPESMSSSNETTSTPTTRSEGLVTSSPDPEPATTLLWTLNATIYGETANIPHALLKLILTLLSFMKCLCFVSVRGVCTSPALPTPRFPRNGSNLKISPKFGTFTCPHPVGDNTCRWRHLDGADSFRPGMRYYMRLRTKTEDAVKWSRGFLIRTKNIVEPGPVNNVTAQEVLHKGILGDFLQVDLTGDNFLENADQQNSSLLLSNETLTNSSEWKESLIRLMQINTPGMGAVTPPTSIQPTSPPEPLERRLRHPRRRQRKRGRGASRPKRDLVPPPPVVEDNLVTVLVSWQKPESLRLLPLEYRVRFHSTSHGRNGKFKHTKTKELLTEEDEIHVEVKRSHVYRVSVEAKPLLNGFWGHPTVFSLKI